MIQLYFLSVLLNAVTGAMLFLGCGSSFDDDDSVSARFFSPFARTETFRFVLGVLTIIIGVIKLLSPISDDVPFVGDIFPAAAGIVAGFDLIYENIRAKKISEIVDKNVSIRRFLDGKTYIGIAAMAAAVLHFLFPTVIFI